MVCIQRANVYMFDEPSSYLDVKQRLNAARAIRELKEADKYRNHFRLMLTVEQLHHCCGARFECARLSFGLHLLPLRVCCCGLWVFVCDFLVNIIALFSIICILIVSETGSVQGAYGVVTMPFSVREGLVLVLVFY